MRRRFGRRFGGTFAGDVPPLLQRANQLLSAGQYAEASSAFEQLARAAEARGGPRAPFFYIQAGRALILAGLIAAGMEQIERGLGVFALRGEPLKAANVGQRVIGDLNARGLSQQAQRIGDYLNELFPGAQGQPAAAAPAGRPALPAHCPGCGAPLRPDEVDWRDNATAVCEYCGSPVHGES